MNQNRVPQTSTDNTAKPLSIRLSKLPINEKAAYVESVCASLIDSRFGPGRSMPVITDLRNLPKHAPAVFYDLTAEGPVPAYSILPDSELARRHAAEVIRSLVEEDERPLVTIRIQNTSPQGLGRGSP